MKLSRLGKVLLVILFITASGYTVYRFVYAPLQEKIREQETLLEANKAVLAHVKAQRKDESLVSELENIEKKINLLERKIVYSKDMPGTFVDLYNLILENKLSGDSISFGSIIEEEKYRSFNISFSVDGKKNNIYNFVQSLQNYKKEISINSITLLPSGTDNMKVSMNIKTYLLKDASGKDPQDYDFMNEKTGSFKQLFDMFKDVSEAEKN